jgi:hypothetical protein
VELTRFAAMVTPRADRFTITVEDGNPVFTQRHIDADKPLCHGTPFARRRGTARTGSAWATKTMGIEDVAAHTLARARVLRGQRWHH